MTYWRILAICCVLAAYLCVVFTADATTASSAADATVASSGNDTATAKTGNASEPGVNDNDKGSAAFITSSILITALSTIIGMYL